MIYTGKIPKINHIVVSDPNYENGVWCRYERDNIKEEDWLVDLSIDKFKMDEESSGIEYCILLHKDNTCKLINGMSMNYEGFTSSKYFKIGVDTACVALGINSKAEEINNSKGLFQPKNALKTGYDGIVGHVNETTKDGNLYYIAITGELSEDIGYSFEKIIDYFKCQFEITDLTKKIDTDVMEL